MSKDIQDMTTTFTLKNEFKGIALTTSTKS